MCLAMNDDRLAPGPVRGEHQQPQLRGPAGRRAGARSSRSPLTAAAAAVTGAHRRRPGAAASESPVQQDPLAARSCCRARTSTPTRSSRRASSSPPRARGSGEALFADWRYDAAGRAAAGLRAQPARGRGRARARGRRATSAAAPRASTRSGRSRPAASTRWSAPPSPTSSAATPSRTASCPSQVDEATHARLVGGAGRRGRRSTSRRATLVLRRRPRGRSRSSPSRATAC